MNDSIKSQIDRYAAGADDLGQAIAGLSREQLNAFPVPGTWSIQQIVLHLFDSDLIYSDRMKRVIAEDRPLLVRCDETTYAANLHYDAMSAPLACGIFAGNRQLTAALLRRLPEGAFQRAGVHTARGLVTLAELVAGAVEHLEHHLKFAAEKRALLTQQ